MSHVYLRHETYRCSSSSFLLCSTTPESVNFPRLIRTKTRPRPRLGAPRPRTRPRLKVPRPRPRPRLETETKTQKSKSRDVLRPRLESRELYHWLYATSSCTSLLSVQSLASLALPDSLIRSVSDLHAMNCNPQVDYY